MAAERLLGPLLRGVLSSALVWITQTAKTMFLVKHLNVKKKKQEIILETRTLIMVHGLECPLAHDFGEELGLKMRTPV